MTSRRDLSSLMNMDDKAGLGYWTQSSSLVPDRSLTRGFTDGCLTVCYSRRAKGRIRQEFCKTTSALARANMGCGNSRPSPSASALQRLHAAAILDEQWTSSGGTMPSTAAEAKRATRLDLSGCTLTPMHGATLSAARPSTSGLSACSHATPENRFFGRTCRFR